LRLKAQVDGIGNRCESTVLVYTKVSDIVRHNRSKVMAVTKHAVLPEEAEEVVAGESVVRESYKRRFQVIGPTLSGRMLSIVVGPVPDQPDVWYVFSARPASRKERAAYHLAKGGSHA
jgi:uncharacterized DUF497 family protein